MPIGNLITLSSGNYIFAYKMTNLYIQSLITNLSYPFTYLNTISTESAPSVVSISNANFISSMSSTSADTYRFSYKNQSNVTSSIGIKPTIHTQQLTFSNTTTVNAPSGGYITNEQNYNGDNISGSSRYTNIPLSGGDYYIYQGDISFDLSGDYANKQYYYIPIAINGVDNPYTSITARIRVNEINPINNIINYTTTFVFQSVGNYIIELDRDIIYIPNISGYNTIITIIVANTNGIPNIQSGSTYSPNISLYGVFGSDSQITSPYTFACFPEGTMVKTPTGNIDIAHITKGTIIVNKHNEPVTVEYNAYGTVEAGLRGPNNWIDPYVIPANTISHNVPDCDTRISPWHRIEIDGQFVEAMKLNKQYDTIKQETTFAPITYYNLRTSEGDNGTMIVNNLTVETYKPHTDHINMQYK